MARSSSSSVSSMFIRSKASPGGARSWPGCCDCQSLSEETFSCRCLRPRLRRIDRQVRTATACTQVAYFERPAKRPRCRNNRKKTSCAASLTSCSLPNSREQIRQTRWRNRSTNTTNAGPSELSRAASAANSSSVRWVISTVMGRDARPLVVSLVAARTGASHPLSPQDRTDSRAILKRGPANPKRSLYAAAAFASFGGIGVSG